MKEEHFKVPIRSLTKQQIRELGAKYNIKLKKSAKKDDLIETLKMELSRSVSDELEQCNMTLKHICDQIECLYYLNTVATPNDLQEEELRKYRVLRDDNILIRDKDHYIYILTGILDIKHPNDDVLRKEYPYFDIELFSATDKKCACLKAHKKVLMAKYEYFKILFSSGFCDSDTNEHTLEFDSLTLLNIIQYAYSDRCTISEPTVPGSVEMIVNLIKAFDFLGCKNYENYIFEYLLPIFTTETLTVEFCRENKKIFEDNLDVPMIKNLFGLSKRRLLSFDKDDLIKFRETQFKMNNKKKSLEDDETIIKSNKKRKIK